VIYWQQTGCHSDLHVSFPTFCSFETWRSSSTGNAGNCMLSTQSICYISLREQNYFCKVPCKIVFVWSSGQSSWLQIQKSRFDSRRYQIFWEVVVLERGSLSHVSTIEELLGRNSSGSGLENREYDRGDTLRWPRDTLYPQKLALTSPTSGGSSVGIVRLRTKATEFFFIRDAACLLWGKEFI
jgi:hypothetical protein